MHQVHWYLLIKHFLSRAYSEDTIPVGVAVLDWKELHIYVGRHDHPLKLLVAQQAKKAVLDALDIGAERTPGTSMILKGDKPFALVAIAGPHDSKILQSLAGSRPAELASWMA